MNTFIYNGNKSLDTNDVPNNVEKLVIHYEKENNYELLPNKIPNTIVHLILGAYYDKAIKKEVLPNNLKILNLGFIFNKEIEEGILPESLEELYLSVFYNIKIGLNILPSKLKLYTPLDNKLPEEGSGVH